MSLRKQTYSGLTWTFLDTFFLNGVSFLAMLYIARILGPKEFGLIGMITVFITIGTSLVDSGLSSSIIRTKHANNRDFSTVFYLNLGMSFLIYLILFLVAPLIAQFFRQDILTGVVRLYCLSFIISAFSAIQLAQLNRNMNFKKILQYNIPGTLIGIGVGIILSLKGFGVWSIVWMQLTKLSIQSILLWLYSSWKPTMYFSKERMNYHYGFGYKLMLSGLLATIFENVYNIIIGRFYSVQSLGYFERARAFNQYPVALIIGIISKVTFPLLSKIQDEKERLAYIFKQMLQFAFFITAPLMLGLAAIASPLFQLVLGDKWMPAVPFFQIICLSNMFAPIHTFNQNTFKVFGRSDLLLRLEVYKKIIISIGILIALPFGILGLIWSSVITSFITMLINTYYSQHLINYKTGRQLLDMLPTILIAGFISLLMFLTVYISKGHSLYFQIVIPTILGIIAYLGINVLFKTSSMQFALHLIKTSEFMKH